MGRNVSRVGGAVVGIIAIIFGILDVQDKVPSWLLIALGVLGIAAVIAEYLWTRRGGDGDVPQRLKQRQEGGHKSTNNQAGRDISITQSPAEGNR